MSLYPILEFDHDRDAFIRPHHIIKPGDVTPNCVLCFFSEAIAEILSRVPHRIVTTFRMESASFPLYELENNGKKVALIQAGVGSPIAAAQIEELTAYGCRKFLACGSCGVLQADLAVGHLIIPTSAVRDEGASYHYVAPSREILADPAANAAIATALDEKGLPYVFGKTWTTDAFYRETRKKIDLRKKEGCITVEMEASAYMAAAQYNGVTFGQILYAGDNLGGAEWDSRSFNTQTEIRSFLLETALDVCLTL